MAGTPVLCASFAVILVQILERIDAVIKKKAAPWSLELKGEGKMEKFERV